MTLSVIDVDNNNFQIVKVDCLTYNVMKAGTDGKDVARSINNLTVIASFQDLTQVYSNNEVILALIPHPCVGYAPLPWSFQYDEAMKLLVIRDAHAKNGGRRTP